MTDNEVTLQAIKELKALNTDEGTAKAILMESEYYDVLDAVRKKFRAVGIPVELQVSVLTQAFAADILAPCGDAPQSIRGKVIELLMRNIVEDLFAVATLVARGPR